MDVILTINAGSSSLKFQIFRVESDRLERVVRGQIEGIGTRPHLRAVSAQGKPLIDRSFAAEAMPDLPTAVAELRAWLRTLEYRLHAVGHRVVHGGPEFARPVRIDARVLEILERYVDLAPLHQPNNLAPIRLVMQIDPALPQVACFDTAFHRDHSPVTDRYALPAHFYEEGVRRYGFHGLSYEYVAEKLGVVAPEIAQGKVIVAHLGSGASMCALSAGRSLESTMGFTALDGLPMGTRPGQLDPGVVLYLFDKKGMSAAAVSDLLYRHSGLKGLSGISSDMRDLLESSAPQAAQAIEHFVHRAGLNVGMLTAALGGLDGFVFTAGIGENSPAIRARLIEKMHWLGAELDERANHAGETCISTKTSRVALYVVPTDEELMIARHTRGLV